MWAKTFFKI